MGEMNRGITKSLLTPVLPTFTEALVGSLNLPTESHDSDVGLKTEVLKGRIILNTLKRDYTLYLPFVIFWGLFNEKKIIFGKGNFLES